MYTKEWASTQTIYKFFLAVKKSHKVHRKTS
jgi:hypothetical protein